MNKMKIIKDTLFAILFIYLSSFSLEMFCTKKNNNNITKNNRAVSVTVTNNGSTITINDGSSRIDVSKVKVFVYTSGDNVTIQWDKVNSRTYNYTQFTAPSGTGAIAVQAAIALMLKI